MSFFGRLFRSERKSAAGFENLASAAFGDLAPNFGLAGSITPQTAMRCSTVAACVAAISGSVASLPLIVYGRGADGAKTRAVEHPLYIILHDAPSDLASAFEFRREMQADALLHGRAFAFIGRLRGAIAELLRIDPTAVTVERQPDGEPSYLVTDAGGAQRRYSREEVFHLEALGGEAPIRQAAGAIRLALLLEQHGSRLFGSGARPGGILTTDKTLSQPVIERLKASFENGFAGAANAGRTAILEDGLQFKPLALTSVDAQFLELRKFQVAEIARAFRVPLHKIGELDRATFSNVEYQALEFVTDCLMPWLKLWEGAIRRSLLTPEERREYFAEFLVDDLLRGDIKSRFEAFSAASLNGFLTINEIRTLENRPPIAGGDIARVPMNTAPLPSSAPQT